MKNKETQQQINLTNIENNCSEKIPISDIGWEYLLKLYKGKEHMLLPREEYFTYAGGPKSPTRFEKDEEYK